MKTNLKDFKMQVNIITILTDNIMTTKAIKAQPLRYYVSN